MNDAEKNSDHMGNVWWLKKESVKKFDEVKILVAETIDVGTFFCNHLFFVFFFARWSFSEGEGGVE